MVRPRAWSGPTRSTTRRRSAASTARWSSIRDLAIARWGIAYAIGPNYNKAWEAFDPVDLAASLARARMELGLAVDGRACGRRTRPDRRAGGPLPHRRSERRRSAAGRPRRLCRRDGRRSAQAYPDDVDVAGAGRRRAASTSPHGRCGTPGPANRPPGHGSWRPSGSSTTRWPRLPVGSTPASCTCTCTPWRCRRTPQRALPAADLLRGLVPDAGHLQHMPSHIDVLCGDYRNSVVSNLICGAGGSTLRRARGAAELLFALPGAQPALRGVLGDVRGQFGDRVAGRRRTRRAVHPRTAGHRVTADGRLAGSVRAVAHSRAGAVRPLGRPDRRHRCPTTPSCTARPRPPSTTGAEWRTPRTVNCAQARAEREAFAAAYDRIPESRYLFNNTSRDILAVAAEMLDGEIAYREGRFDDAFAHLRRAVELDDSLPYDEPWGWMQPTRHAYGALLLEQGQVEEAAAGVRRRPRAGSDAEPAAASIPATCGACTATTSA